jgi:hypothetical protein
MSDTLQTILVAVAVIAAALWLAVDQIRRRRAKSKCDGCALAQSMLPRDD